MLLDTTTLARGLLMLSPRPRLMPILLFSMVLMDMADMAWVMLDMLDLAMDIPMLLDTTTLERGLLMLSPRPRLMLILLFSMVLMDTADMVWVMLDMLDLAMDIPMPLDTITLARGLLMLSPRPRLMLILLFSMVLMDMADMAWV